MNVRAHETAAIALCAMVSLSSGVSAQAPVKPHQAKAAPAAPLTTPLEAESFARPPIATVTPKKPPLVVTAVAAPQPILPGHVGPGVSIR